MTFFFKEFWKDEIILTELGECIKYKESQISFFLFLWTFNKFIKKKRISIDLSTAIENKKYLGKEQSAAKVGTSSPPR